LGVSSSFGDSGDYIFQASTTLFSVQEVAAQISEIGWGIPTVIKHDESAGDTMSVNITALTGDGQQLAQWALDAWSEVLDIDFQTSGSSGADIIFDDNEDGAFAGPSSYNPNTGIISQSAVNVNAGWISDYGSTYDSYTYLVYLHEIGHALGLMHSGNYDGAANYGVNNHFENDSYLMSVMSYFNIDDAGQGDYSIAVTPMIADVFAVWGMYGEPVSVKAGNTVWGANSNVTGTLGTVMGYVFDGDTVNSNIYGGGAISFTVTDTSGFDTLDLSNAFSAQLIDMREGGVSNVNGNDGNLVISLGSVIEAAIGGFGADTIIGNDADNTITGGGGNDNVDGGTGTDTVVINATFGSAAVTELANGSIRVTTSQGTDTYSNVEFFEFSDQTVSATVLLGGSPGQTIIGTPDRDTLTGTDGDDLIEGRGTGDLVLAGDGNDRIFGGEGDDGLKGGNGNDYIVGGEGNDNMPGEAGDDILYGGAGDDAMGGSFGNDYLYGGDGNDRGGAGAGIDFLYGGLGDDLLSGGADTDTLFGGEGNDNLAGSFGSDESYGGEGNDAMGGGRGFDTIYGEAGHDAIGAGFHNDTVYGGAGNDITNGGDGDDTLFGGTGNDTLNGGNGNDFMTGGSGADTFKFLNPTNGAVDTIRDFEGGFDTLAIDRVGGPGDQGKFDSLSITQVGSDTEIEWRGHTIVLNNFEAITLTVNDFDFI